MDAGRSDARRMAGDRLLVVTRDGDLLVDGKEDSNGNCIVDATETDRLKADTDGDGVSDLVEVALTGVPCAKDPTCTPAKKGTQVTLLTG